MIGAIALLQLAGSPPAAVPLTPRCAGTASVDILVCGSRDKKRSPYRLPVIADIYQPKKIRAETTLPGGVHAEGTIQSGTRGDGLQDNRMMLTLSTGF